MKLRALILVFLMGMLTSVCSIAEEPLKKACRNWSVQLQKETGIKLQQ